MAERIVIKLGNTNTTIRTEGNILKNTSISVPNRMAEEKQVTYNNLRNNSTSDYKTMKSDLSSIKKISNTRRISPVTTANNSNYSEAKSVSSSSRMRIEDNKISTVPIDERSEMKSRDNQSSSNNNNNNNNKAVDLIISTINQSETIGFQCSNQNNNHSTYLDGNRFTMAPSDARGRRVDLSDRPLLCSSTNGTNEIVFGGSDHALYSVDVNDVRKKPITMYTKTCGHTDWVTSVCHLSDGRVLSSAMDGKLCLWDNTRRKCIDLLGGHTKSISKVITDKRFNTAVSCGYDKQVALWAFNDNIVNQPLRTSSIVKRGSTIQKNVDPSALLLHPDIVLECSYNNNTLATGLRDGGLFLWDLSTCTTSHKIKGHQKGPITAIEFNQHDNTILTGGSDGFIKLWDPRKGKSAQDTLIQRISAHCEQENDGGIKSAVVSCMAQIRNGNYLISGGSDNKIVLMDSRRNYEIIEKWSNHAKNCVYSMCVVGDSCVFVGDGVGKVLCYDLINGGLKYGLGGSEQGAVRSMNCIDNKLAVCGEDGKSLIFSY